MKWLLIFFITVFVSCKSKSAQMDCSAIHEGKFKTVMRLGEDSVTFFIYRDKYKQIEEDDQGMMKVEFRIKWLTDCLYELSERKMLKGEDPDMGKGPVMFVRIIEATANSFIAETTGTTPEGPNMKFSYVRVP